MTGVQTCALPICHRGAQAGADAIYLPEPCGCARVLAQGAEQTGDEHGGPEQLSETFAAAGGEKLNHGNDAKRHQHPHPSNAALWSISVHVCVRWQAWSGERSRRRGGCHHLRLLLWCGALMVVAASNQPAIIIPPRLNVAYKFISMLGMDAVVPASSFANRIVKRINAIADPMKKYPIA